MLFYRSPKLYKCFYPDALWQMEVDGERVVYLTFDDGPIPQITTWILETLAKHDAKATFFMVGDNVSKYYSIYQEVLKEGHIVGNHTYHHLNGIRFSSQYYLDDIYLADRILDTTLFRPPYGLMSREQYYLIKTYKKVVMSDLVVHDYRKNLTPGGMLAIVKKYVRSGSIITFHDSLRSYDLLLRGLDDVISLIKELGFSLQLIPNRI